MKEPPNRNVGNVRLGKIQTHSLLIQKDIPFRTLRDGVQLDE